MGHSATEPHLARYASLAGPGGPCRLRAVPTRLAIYTSPTFDGETWRRTLTRGEGHRRNQGFDDLAH
jgi:hypothetical protein